MINTRATWWGKRVLAWFAAGVVVSLVIGVGAAMVHRWVRNEHAGLYHRTFLRHHEFAKGIYTPVRPDFCASWSLLRGPLLRSTATEFMRTERAMLVWNNFLLEQRQPGFTTVWLGSAKPPVWSVASELDRSSGGGTDSGGERWTDYAYGWPTPVVASRWVSRPWLVFVAEINQAPGRLRISIDGLPGERTDATVLSKWLDSTLGDAAQDVPGRVVWSGLGVSGVVWGGMMAGVWYGVVLTIVGVRGWRRRNAGRCLKCGYSRDGLAEGAVCPECGGGGCE